MKITNVLGAVAASAMLTDADYTEMLGRLQLRPRVIDLQPA